MGEVASADDREQNVLDMLSEVLTWLLISDPEVRFGRRVACVEKDAQATSIGAGFLGNNSRFPETEA